MKFTSLLLTLLVAAPALAKEELRSEQMKQSICGTVNTIVAFDEKYMIEDNLDTKACAKSGRFTVIELNYDKKLHETTMMRVEFDSLLGPLKIQGIALMSLKIEIGKKNEWNKQWVYKLEKLETQDTRGTLELVARFFDNEEIDFHNGSGSYGKVTSIPSVKTLTRELEDLLEDGACYFENNDDIEYSIARLRFYSEEFSSFLLRLHKQGKLARGVARLSEDGESESCSLDSFRFYTTDKVEIILDFDFTT